MRPSPAAGPPSRSDDRTARALFFIPSLRTGGAQRVFATLLNDLAATGMVLHLAVLQREGEFFAELSPLVTVHDLAVRRALQSAPRLRRLVGRLRPDVLLATSLRLNLLAALLKPVFPSGTRVVIREVTALDALLGDGWRASCLRALTRFAYPRADAILCQSPWLQADLRRLCGSGLPQSLVIPNPADFEGAALRAEAGRPYEGAGPGPHVVAVGRLEPAKGIDRLLTAFPSLLRKRPHAQLWLVGDGRESSRLAEQSRALGVRDRVHFVGMQSNPYPWMRWADLFVLPSRREGMSNALLEAIACQCPVVVLDHPGGTRDVLRETGQEWRMVDDLSAWDAAWFERPPPSVLSRARELFDRRIVVEAYRQILCDAETDVHGSRRAA
jgi:glycosyltransferase involved in cell wall biosynthesis